MRTPSNLQKGFKIAFQGQNSTTNIGRNGDQLHHVDIQYQVREDSPDQRTCQPSNARNDRETMMSQSQFNSLLDQVKNQMVSSIKEWVIPYVDKLANSQGQEKQRMNEDMYAYRPPRNGLEPPRMGEN